MRAVDFKTWVSRPGNLENGFIVVALPILLVALTLVDLPDEPALVLCAFRNLTGLPCPGCGMTRGLAALLKGRLIESLHFHAFAPLVFLVAVMGWSRSLCWLTNRQGMVNRLSRLTRYWKRPIAGWGTLGVIMIYWAGRLFKVVP